MKSGAQLTTILLVLASATLGQAQDVLPAPSEPLILGRPVVESPIDLEAPIAFESDNDFLVGEPTPADPLTNNGDGIEYLNRGPVHEAFATQVTSDPNDTPLINKTPPEPVNEIPPQVELDDDRAIWITGYWAWDEDRTDYLWVSGVWRVPPENRRWVAGYWTTVNDENGNELGHQWVSGFWTEDAQQVVNYVPQPPASLETGPSHPATSEDHFWNPGNWVIDPNVGSNYAWQPGHWQENQVDRVWVPSHYVSTPQGCVFVSGYWDYPIVDRGCLFTPVYIDQQVVARPDFSYQPTYVVNTPNLYQHLFVCPTTHHYFFGDYYAPVYRNRYHSHAHFHRRGFGYDPFFVHYQHHYRRRGINYGTTLSNWNVHVSINLSSRPSRTVRGQQDYLRRLGPSRAEKFVLTRSLNDYASRRNGRSGNARGQRPNPTTIVRGSSDKIPRNNPKFDSPLRGPAKNLYSSANVSRGSRDRVPKQPAISKPNVAKTRTGSAPRKPDIARNQSRPNQPGRPKTNLTPAARTLAKPKARLATPNVKNPQLQLSTNRPTLSNTTSKPQRKFRDEVVRRATPRAATNPSKAKANFVPPNRRPSTSPTRTVAKPTSVKKSKPARQPNVKQQTVRRPQPAAKGVRNQPTRTPKTTRTPQNVTRRTPTPTQARANFTPPNRRQSTPKPQVSRTPKPQVSRTPKATRTPQVRRPQPASRAPKVSRSKPQSRTSRPNPSQSKARFTPPNKKSRKKK